MVTLFLDFASFKKSIGLVAGEKTVSLRPIDDHTDEARLMPTIETMLAETFTKNKKLLPTEVRLGRTKAGITNNFSVLDRIATVSGPGGFMSLRVGIALANALSWSLKIPLAGIHLADLWAARFPHPRPLPRRGRGANEVSGVGEFLWLHSTKRDAIFIRGFGALEHVWPEAKLLNIEEFEKWLKKAKKTVHYVGELIPEHQGLTVMLETAKHIEPLENILPKFLQNLSYEMKPLVPWYGRKG